MNRTSPGLSLLTFPHGKTESVDGNWNANVVNWLVLAMAHHRLGRADDARTWFDKAAKWIDPAWSKEPGAGLRLLHRHDQAACVVLRREAEAQLGPRPGPPASGGKK